MKYKVRVNSSTESESVETFLENNGFNKPYGNFILINGWVCIDENKNILCVAESQAGKECDGYKTISFDQLKDMLKPKEYLFKRIDGSYHIIDHDCQGRAIEIPEGADTAILYHKNKELYFWKNYIFYYRDETWVDCTINDNITTQEEFLSIWDGDCSIAWKRHTQPEELPFVDDDLHKVEQDTKYIRENYPNGFPLKHPHYFIDVSDTDSIDFYEIAHRYGISDPCVQHILKKCLAIGNRGHKSLHTDMKDIHDTAVRMLAMHGIS